MTTWTACLTRVSIAVAIATGLFAPSAFAESRGRPPFGRFMSAYRLKARVEREDRKGPWRYSAELVHPSKTVEMKDSPHDGTLEPVVGWGRTRVGALNDLLRQIRGKQMVIGAFSPDREEHSVPRSFRTDTFKRLPAHPETIGK
jgi:hypothetical protein